MDNYQIADNFSLLSKLMDIHGENSFKSKSYGAAAFAIERLTIPLADTDKNKIAAIKGIGSSSAEKIIELLQTGKINALEHIISQTPPGILEMMQIKGVGPKKIHVIWKEMGIETVGELLYACKENRLKLFKGFGEKTQQNIIDTIEFYQKHKESHLFAYAEALYPSFVTLLEDQFGKEHTRVTGKFLRQWETLEALEFVIRHPQEHIIERLQSIPGFERKESTGDILEYQTGLGILLRIYPAVDTRDFITNSFKMSCSQEFYEAITTAYPEFLQASVEDESVWFKKADLPIIPAFLREHPSILHPSIHSRLPQVIAEKDIKGLIHCHSNWSDGNNSVEELAQSCIEMGLEYMVISDHSKSAFYAQGLHEEKIRAQHELIEALNQQLAPFTIFKSIECDILNDGQLDYENQVLESFDLIIASVHSHLKMSHEKAMARLLRAIENPHTTILGHMTGRLLLSRSGYPVDHKTIIDACAAHQVVIELNANPNRLDIDWRHISYALEKNVLISINPDAHSLEGIKDIHFGVLQAQKAMVTSKNNLSSYSLSEFRKFLSDRKKKKGI